eukprot:9499804-Pyramimonas_sp.AAC.1
MSGRRMIRRPPAVRLQGCPRRAGCRARLLVGWPKRLFRSVPPLSSAASSAATALRPLDRGHLWQTIHQGSGSAVFSTGAALCASETPAEERSQNRSLLQRQ